MLVRSANGIDKHMHGPSYKHASGPQPCANAMRHFGARSNGGKATRQHDAATRGTDNQNYMHKRKNHRRRHRPRPTPRPVTTAEHSRMQSLTTSLLCLDTNPPGSFTPPLIRTVHETIFWNLHLKSYEGTAAADELIRRLVLERTDGWNGNCIVAGRAVEAVLDSWRILSASSKSTKTKALSQHDIPAEERADSLLQYLHQSSTADGANDRSLAPSSKSYNMVIDAHARAGRPDDARRVYECHPKPDVVSFNGLLKAFSVAIPQDANSDHGKRWADEAEKLLQEQEGVFDENGDEKKGAFGPNDVSYGTVIGALSKLASEDGALRAENTLRRMVERFYLENDVDGDIPCANTVVFAQVLSAWAKSGSSDAGQRAEKVLRRMEHANVPANAVCYNAAIDAWSRSPDEDAAERAELLLREMEHQRDLRQAEGEQRKRRDNILNPTTVTYTSVITAWARSNQPHSAERAEAVLSDMIYAYDRMRDASIRPNQLSYGAILAAWAGSRHPKAADRAEKILNGLIDRYSRGEGGDECRPNEVMFNSVLHALSNSSRTDATDRARELLGRMWKLYDNCGHLDVRPTTTTYNCLLHCLAKSKREDLARETLKLLGQMERDNSIPAPDIYSYVSAVDALAAEGNAEAAEKAHAIVDRVEAFYRCSSDTKLRPNILLYTALVRAVDASGEVESASIQSIEDRVRRADIKIDSLFSLAVENARKRCRRSRA